MDFANTARLTLVASAYALLAPASAWAAGPAPTLAALQTDDHEPAEAGDAAASSDEEKAGGSEDEPPAEKSKGDERTAQDETSPESPWVEQENTNYRFVGVRARMVVIPSFMFDLYQADGGKTVTAPVVGLEYASRRNGFEWDAWITYASWSMDASPFKAKSDPDNAYEIVRSELKTLTIGADFLWSVPLDKGFSFTYGGGGGLGVVFGSLYRQQSYPPGAPGDPETYVPCPAPGAGNPEYCANDNDHYGDYTEPSWLDGGSKPVVFPWIALPQLGLRWKASRQLALRFDTGLSFPGPFFFGLSGQYGLK